MKKVTEEELLIGAMEVYLLKTRADGNNGVNDALSCLKQATKNLLKKDEIPDWQFVKMYNICIAD